MSPPQYAISRVKCCIVADIRCAWAGDNGGDPGSSAANLPPSPHLMAWSHVTKANSLVFRSLFIPSLGLTLIFPGTLYSPEYRIIIRACEKADTQQMHVAVHRPEDGAYLEIISRHVFVISNNLRGLRWELGAD